MSAGKATGEDRDYQKDSLEAIRWLEGAPGRSLVPYSGDGIDVGIEICGTTRTLDVALRDEQEGVVLGESKRINRRVKPAEMSAFAHLVLRRAADQVTRGYYFAKSGYQRGALITGAFERITTILLPEGQPFPAFSLAVQTWGKRGNSRARLLQHGYVNQQGLLTFSGSLSVVVHRVGELPSPSVTVA